VQLSFCLIQVQLDNRWKTNYQPGAKAIVCKRRKGKCASTWGGKHFIAYCINRSDRPKYIRPERYRLNSVAALKRFTFSGPSLVLYARQQRAAQEWRYYGGDAGGMRFSPLTQIAVKM